MSNNASAKASAQVTSLILTPPFIASRAVIVSFFVVLGVVGNGFVLKFYGKNKKLTGQVYILALAVIDLVACVVILPQMPLLGLQVKKELSAVIHFTLAVQNILQGLSFFGVQVTMALDQFIAVFWPFKQARLRQSLKRSAIAVGGVLLVLCISLVSAFQVLNASDDKYALVFFVLGVVSLAVLFVTYTTTAYKLYRQNAIIRPQPQIQLQKIENHAPDNTNQPQPTSSDSASTTSMHVRAMKIYTAILLQFLLASIVSQLVITVFGQLWMVYFFYINHIGNPVIYYCFVPKFREGVKKHARAFFHRN